jgi:hypothetical protein
MWPEASAGKKACFREEDFTGSTLKNMAGALHADRVGCTLSVDREVKIEIPVKTEISAKLMQYVPIRLDLIQCFSAFLVLAKSLTEVNPWRASTLFP